MALSINNNIQAFNAYRNLSVTQGDLSKSLEKLSSGFRINRAADDAAGLAISEGLRSQVGGLKQAVRNSQDGISVVQTAEGALTETTSILQRMRTLSVQAASSGSLSTDAKSNIQKEVGELQSELTRISDTTQFNGTKLLDGNYKGVFQVGANTGEKINVNLNSSLSATGLNVQGVDVTLDIATDALAATAATPATTTAKAAVSVTAGDAAQAATFDKLNGAISVNGKSFDLASVQFKPGSTATDRLTALNVALTNTFGKTGAVSNVVASADGTTGIKFEGTVSASTSADDIAKAAVSFTQASGADSAIKAIDGAIKTVSSTRAELGAKQNRLEHTINNLNVAVENLSASESRIRDTDMAAEMTMFTRSQILSQAGTAMLAQANQLPQGVLSLLR